MDTGNFYTKSYRLITVLSKTASRIGASILVGMMLLITLDVVSRSVLNKPLPGTFELVEVMMGAVVSLSIAYCGIQRGHVYVELFTDKLHGRVRKTFELLHHLVAILFFAAVSYEGAQQAIVIKESDAATTLLGIPIYPFIWILAFGAALLAFVYLGQLIEIYRKRAS